MRMFVEYNFILNELAHNMLMVPVNYWCPNNVEYIILTITDYNIKMCVHLFDGNTKSFTTDIPSAYKYYYDTDNVKDERTKLANKFRDNVKIFAAFKSYLNKRYEKDTNMGKAIANKKGFMILCDNMDLLTSQLGPDNIKLMRFENNNAILQVFDKEVTINLDDVVNMDYKQFMFKIAEVYSDEDGNKKS